MSLGLYTLPDIYQSSWIEMKPNIAMRYEIDHANELAILFFGHHNDYVITLGQDNLRQLVDLGAAAQRELAGPPAENQ